MAMANNRLVDQATRSVADAQVARVASQSSARHPYFAALTDIAQPDAARNLADAVHLLCNLYGGHPGLLESALSLSQSGAAHDWLKEAVDGFERERLYLVRLTSAIGPLPSTPGAAETEATLSSQRHALETLARSERRGCALGAATALVADWRTILQGPEAATGNPLAPTSVSAIRRDWCPSGRTSPNHPGRAP